MTNDAYTKKINRIFRPNISLKKCEKKYAKIKETMEIPYNVDHYVSGMLSGFRLADKKKLSKSGSEFMRTKMYSIKPEKYQNSKPDVISLIKNIGTENNFSDELFNGGFTPFSYTGKLR